MYRQLATLGDPRAEPLLHELTGAPELTLEHRMLAVQMLAERSPKLVGHYLRQLLERPGLSAMSSEAVRAALARWEEVHSPDA